MISELAAQQGIAIRGGCLCNPGECYLYSQVDESDLDSIVQQLESCSIPLNDGDDITDALGVVRVSLGYLSNKR
eukprot:gnl/Chilomastix_caulleri/4921.p1 GENE.gnl/Chilomastix_caulleri/4921~~gnl/Chilomastix_caulleri/4921.p1  ORF type:complete len:74 (+),score=23.48 gnl/Chilomastix_caulleri/4921:140-361(+)